MYLGRGMKWANFAVFIGCFFGLYAVGAGQKIDLGTQVKGILKPINGGIASYNVASFDTTSNTAGINECINGVTGPHTCVLGAGNFTIKSPITIPSGGYRLTGQSRKSTVLVVDPSFSLAALGVIIFSVGPPGNLNFGQVDNLTIKFPLPPDSPDALDYQFTIGAANATNGAVYSNNTSNFTVVGTITGSTTLYAFGTANPAASGVLNKVSGIGDTTITFTTYKAPYTHWPAGFYVQNAAYTHLYEVQVDEAWIGVDARNNGPISILSSWISGFDHAVWIGAPGDTNRLTDVHITCGANCTTNNIIAGGANSIGVQVDEAYLGADNILCTNATKTSLKVTGGSHVYVSNWAFDWGNGAQIEGGVNSIASGYFTPSLGHFAANVIGGSLTIASSTVIADIVASPIGLFSISNDIGGVASLIVTATQITIPGDTMLLQQVLPTQGGTYLSFSHSYVATNCLLPGCTQALVYLGGGAIGGNFSDNTFFNAGTAIQDVIFLASAPISGFHIIWNNDLIGYWNYNVPTSIPNVVLNMPLSNNGGIVASATTITALGAVFHISGTAAISTMNKPINSYAPTVCAIADGVYTVAGGGNFAKTYTATVGTTKCWVYDEASSTWY